VGRRSGAAMMTPANVANRSPWLLTPEELHNTPSQASGDFTFEQELNLRSNGAAFIQTVGRSMR